MKKLLVFGLAAAVLTMSLVGCDTDARVASRNLSKAAEQFEISRRIVFYNGITDQYLLVIEGKCSIEPTSTNIKVVCKTSGDGIDEFKKHYLGLSDNVTYFAEQIDGATVSASQYRVIFKPASLVPNIDLVK